MLNCWTFQIGLHWKSRQLQRCAGVQAVTEGCPDVSICKAVGTTWRALNCASRPFHLRMMVGQSMSWTFLPESALGTNPGIMPLEATKAISWLHIYGFLQLLAQPFSVLYHQSGLDAAQHEWFVSGLRLSVYILRNESARRCLSTSKVFLQSFVL